MTARVSVASPERPSQFEELRRAGWAVWVGLAIVAVNLLAAVFGTVVAPYTPGEFVSQQAFAPPGGGSLLGTDYLGRDVLSRILYGAAPTIGLALLSTLIGVAAGTLFGFVAAVVGGRPDEIITRITDILISFPPILLALLLIAGLGASFLVLVVTVALVHSLRVVRVSRAIAMNIAVLEFVEAARARGEGLFSILWREIWPNARRPLAAEFGLRLTFSILLISSISFLGLGLPPPSSDWGGMVRENLGGLYSGSVAVLAPAFAIGLLTIGINLIVDWFARRAGREVDVAA